MAKDVTDLLRDTVTQVAREAAQTVGSNGGRRSNGALSGGRGLAAGAGLAALAPLARKGAGAYVKRRMKSGGGAGDALKKASPARAVKKAGDRVGEGVGKRMKETVGQKVDEAGGVGGIAKEAGKGLLPGGGGQESGGKGGAVPGVGKGRRMPVQQAVDVAVPVETAYNQWTQFAEWPSFMHRLDNVSQEDDCTVSFRTKIWGMSREFQAEIETQRPEERIKWSVKQGPIHAGVVTFHELAPRLTRIEVNVDVEPGSLIEKAARGMRHVKRAIRADLHRFKAFIEMEEMETGAWRGVIEDGELVEPHPDDYDEERDYGDVEDQRADEEPEASAEEEEEEEEPEEEESQRARTERFERQARASRSRGGGERPKKPRKPAGRR